MSRNPDDRLLEAKYELDKLKLAIEENKRAIAEAETLLRVLEENRQQNERDFARVQAEIRAIEGTPPAEAKRSIDDIISATTAFRTTESLLRAALYTEAEVARQAEAEAARQVEAEVARQAETEVNDRLKEGTPDKVEGKSQGVIAKVKDAAKKASDAIKDATKQTGDTTKETH